MVSVFRLIACCLLALVVRIRLRLRLHFLLYIEQGALAICIVAKNYRDRVAFDEVAVNLYGIVFLEDRIAQRGHQRPS